MRVLAFIKAVIMENIGNILACPNHSTLERFNCIHPMKTLRGLRHWDIFIHLIKNAAFIKRQTVVKHGSKLYLLTIPLVPLILMSIQKIQTSYMLPCGAGAVVHGSLGKAVSQVAFIRAMTEETHGKKFRVTAQGL